MIPRPTARLRFRDMADSDLDAMAALLSDAEVMAYYPAPKSRDEAHEWISRNRRRYDEFGFGLWIIETLGGEFVGDCGLTWQPFGGGMVLEVGYHVRKDLQGRGFATEAAAACRDLAQTRSMGKLHAIIHAQNAASRRVAEKLGMTVIAVEPRDGFDVLVFA